MIFMWQHTIHFQMLWRDIHVAKLCHEYHVAKFKRRNNLIHNVATWFAFGKLATCLSRHKKLPHAFQRRESTRRYFWLVKWFSPLPRDNHVAGGSFSCSVNWNLLYLYICWLYFYGIIYYLMPLIKPMMEIEYHNDLWLQCCTFSTEVKLWGNLYWFTLI